MSFNSIPAALLAHYRAGSFFTDALTAYPNAAFAKPPAGTAWAALFSIPSQTSALSLRDRDEMSGVFQIDLNYPVNLGAGAVQAKADAIRAHFKRGTITAGVEIGSVSVALGEPVDGWYRLPISILYRSFAAV